MNLRFWKCQTTDVTEISVTEVDGDYAKTTQKAIYVKAQTSEKALELFEKLRKQQNE